MAEYSQQRGVRRPSEEQRGFINKNMYKEDPDENMGLYGRFLASSVRDLKSPIFYRALLGEMMGVFFLVFVGCMSPYKTQNFDHPKVALAFGLSVATMVWVLSHVSGGHINPAVSMGMFVARKISLAKLVLYIIFQMIGALLASAAQKGLTCEWQIEYVKQDKPDHLRTCDLGTTDLNTGISLGQGFCVEFLITFVLVITVFASCDATRHDLSGSAPLAIGLSVTMCHLSFIKVTGASMNPARSFGPAVIGNKLENHWLYWVAPMLGGVVAALMYEFLFAGNASVKKFLKWLKSANYNSLYSRPDLDPDVDLKVHQPPTEVQETHLQKSV